MREFIHAFLFLGALYWLYEWSGLGIKQTEELWSIMVMYSFIVGTWYIIKSATTDRDTFSAIFFSSFSLMGKVFLVLFLVHELNKLANARFSEKNQ